MAGVCLINKRNKADVPFTEHKDGSFDLAATHHPQTVEMGSTKV